VSTWLREPRSRLVAVYAVLFALAAAMPALPGGMGVTVVASASELARADLIAFVAVVLAQCALLVRLAL
jgi:hypothetical protein